MAEDGARYFGPFASRGIPGDPGRHCARPAPAHRARVFPGTWEGPPLPELPMGRCDGLLPEGHGPVQMGRPSNRRCPLLEGKFQEVGEDDPRRDGAGRGGARALSGAAQLRDSFRAIELLGKRQKVVAGSPGRHRRGGFSPGRGQELLCGPPTMWTGSWPPRTWTCWRPRVGGGRGDVIFRPGAGLLRGTGGPAPSDPAALRAGRPGAPSPGCCLNRWAAGGCISSRPSGGQDGSDSPGHQERGGRRWPGHHPGGAPE